MVSGPEVREHNSNLPLDSPGSPDAAPLHRNGNQAINGNRSIDVDQYACKKSVAESMLDIALLMANASQLKAVIEQGPGFNFFLPLVVFISISLVLQIGVIVLLIILVVNYDLNDPVNQAKMNLLNNLATGLVFIIVVVNIFITAFVVQKPLWFVDFW